MWQLPLPDNASYLPVVELAGWSVPGVCLSMQASREGLRNPAHNDALAEHDIAGGTGIAAAGRGVKLTLVVRGNQEQAVWVGVGSDDLDVNGQLDGLECRLMAGLDRGRWGLRPRGLGETVWAPAYLHADGGACTLEVSVAADGHNLTVTVADAAGRRRPEAFAGFDPEWDESQADAASEWRLARIETRGAGSELLSLSLRHAHSGVLIVR